MCAAVLAKGVHIDGAVKLVDSVPWLRSTNRVAESALQGSVIISGQSYSALEKTGYNITHRAKPPAAFGKDWHADTASESECHLGRMLHVDGNPCNLLPSSMQTGHTHNVQILKAWIHFVCGHMPKGERILVTIELQNV